MDAGDQGTGTWREGLDRLLAGVWLGDADTASDGHQRPALPVSGDLGADPATLSASLDWLDGLVCLLDDWQREASPGHWADRLDRVLDQVLAAGDGRGAPGFARLRFDCQPDCQPFLLLPAGF